MKLNYQNSQLLLDTEEQKKPKTPTFLASTGILNCSTRFVVIVLINEDILMEDNRLGSVTWKFDENALMTLRDSDTVLIIYTEQSITGMRYEPWADL